MLRWVNSRAQNAFPAFHVVNSRIDKRVNNIVLDAAKLEQYLSNQIKPFSRLV